MLAFLAGCRAVFAIASDVKDRPEGVLQCERLENEFFAACKMLTAWDDGKRFFSPNRA